MEAGTKRATIYFDSALHQALRMKSAETSRSVSELVNNAVRETSPRMLRTLRRLRSGPTSR